MQLFFSHDVIVITLKVCITILAAIIINTILRSFIRVPKQIGLRRSETYAAVLRNTISVIVYAIAAHYVLIVLGINITPFLASAGIAGLAIGLGAKSLIEDFIAGLFLLGQATIAIGDYVLINTTEGFIEAISLRTLSIRDETGALHIIPNGIVKEVTNYSRGKTHVHIDIPVKSDQPINTVLKILNDAMKKLQSEKSAYTLYPESQVLGIDNFQQGNIMTIRITLVTIASQRWEISKKMRLLIKEGFEKNKLSFA